MLNYVLINSTFLDETPLSLLHGWDHKSLYYNKGACEIKVKRT
jgi:hypothetical protein